MQADILFFFAPESLDVPSKNQTMAEATGIASSLSQAGAVCSEVSEAEVVPEPSTRANGTNNFQQPNFEDTQSFLEEVNFKLETLKEVINWVSRK